jgi:hypothetical protein
VSQLGIPPRSLAHLLTVGQDQLMTDAPSTAEAERRSRRGFRVIGTAILAFSVQGFILASAIRGQNATVGIIWALVVVAFIGLFMFERSRERTRRRRDTSDES